MPHFSHAKDTTIHGGSFTDVQGDHIVVQGNLSVNESEEGILALKAASSLGATHDSLERVPPPKCQPGTRKIPLSRIDAWLENMENACRRRAIESRGEEPESSGSASPGDTRDQGRILWLHGPAGAGKSAVAQTISEKYALGQKLVASFFFSRDTPGRDIAKHVFPTIAYQISMNIPGMRTIVGSAIQRDPSIFTKSLETQVQQLIVRPFKSLASSTSTPPGRFPFLVILDGLDECRNKDDHRRILRLLADILYKYRLPLGFVVVSRPEQHIMQTLRSSVFLDHGITEELSLYADINRDETHLDVRAFLLAEFKRIALSYNHRRRKPLPGIWPSTTTIDLLVTKSGGYFIYVTTIIRFVDKEFFSPVERLERILNTPSSDESPMGELDRLYQQILSTNPRTDLLVRILGAIFIPCPPAGIYPIPSLTFDMIECLFGANDGTVLSMLDGMHSLIRVEGATVKPFHASFKDFLFDETRAGSFFVNLKKHHGDIALNFLTNLAQCEAKSAHSDKMLLSLTWPFHASHASDPSVVTGKLRAISNAQWRVVVDSFEQSPRHIIYMLREAMVWLQHLEDPGPNLALEMTSLLDYTFTQRLMDPGVDNTFIQELSNLSGNGITSFSRRDVIEDVRYARADSIFESFMDNSERSAGLFDDPALCHARLAFGCMNLLIGEKFGYYYQHSDRVHNR
ncbi:hypothetical protein FPV67DRAFT_1665374 [Lyophyllum atratum]|nr:hypothetical protein FPV67DRAFT_1665374 [Lyophyllum atratum]